MGMDNLSHFHTPLCPPPFALAKEFSHEDYVALPSLLRSLWEDTSGSWPGCSWEVRALWPRSGGLAFLSFSMEVKSHPGMSSCLHSRLPNYNIPLPPAEPTGVWCTSAPSPSVEEGEITTSLGGSGQQVAGKGESRVGEGTPSPPPRQEGPRRGRHEVQQSLQSEQPLPREAKGTLGGSPSGTLDGFVSGGSHLGSSTHEYKVRPPPRSVVLFPFSDLMPFRFIMGLCLHNP